MDSLVLFFDQIDRASLPLVGGKGANLGELSKAGFPVPPGFCLTTRAYKEFIATSSEMDSFFVQLDQLNPHDLDQLRALGQQIRNHLQQLEVPDDLRREIFSAWNTIGKEFTYAIRSSATAEDLPTASFAGQQDTYLNIKGQEDLLRQIRQCWVSLFTDRAIAYRAKNGFDHRQVYLSVVVQRMVHPETSGILFTADPINGNRKVVSIDASFGLGEAIVSGMVSADLYKVKANQIIQKNISEKKIAIFSLPEGGTVKQELPLSQRNKPALNDEQILHLAELGKAIEQHFGSPQDIEFCIEQGKVFIVQSRPITTLFPIPDHLVDSFRVMVSFGHIQMMTDAIKPLGISIIKTLAPKKLFVETGGRIFIDLTDILRHPLPQKIFPKLAANADEKISRAIKEVIQREEFRKTSAKSVFNRSVPRFLFPILKKAWQNYHKGDPRDIKREIDSYIEEKKTEVKKILAKAKGADRITAIENYLDKFLVKLFPIVLSYMLPYFVSMARLRKKLIDLLGSDQELAHLNKSLPGNITTEMGLELGDLADLVRNSPKALEYLQKADDSTFIEGFANLPDGQKIQQAFISFLSKYGMRCPGEIDITRARWREAPTQLVPAILGHINSVNPQEHRQRFQQGEVEALSSQEKILEKVQNSSYKTKRLRRLIDLYRHLGPLREHHKYLLVLIIDECKKAIMSEAKQLVEKGIFQQVEDVYYVSLDELKKILNGEFRQDISQLIVRRKEEYKWHQTLKPPRVMTSEGEIVTGAPKKGKFPEGSLVGTPASSGVVVGKARIILNPDKAQLNEGEILVAPHTDPGWTPLFPSAKALITEVGGLMTHGSVVAREYGIPAVVGVDDATKIIKDGQQIRVDGDQGFVEILENNP